MISPKKTKKPQRQRFQSKKIKPADISQFARQIATMISAGIPMVQSFDIIAKSNDNFLVKKLVFSIKNDIEGGHSLSEALHVRPQHFDTLFCSLVAAGETSGSLDIMLDRIATYKEKSESLKRKIKKALFYPTAVLIVAMIVTIILLVFVVPQFENLFKSFGADLPVFTQMVVNLSKLLQKWWWIGVIMMSGLIWLLAWLKNHSEKFNALQDRLSLKIPIIGSILHKAVIARFARTLATTFAAGVPLTEALASVAGATGNSLYAGAIHKIREEVSTGTPLQQAMRHTELFPNMVIQMVEIGEGSGSLDKMLAKIATIFEEEVDTAVDGLSSLLEPLIMVVLGVLVGGLVVAMYLPIFKMGAAI